EKVSGAKINADNSASRSTLCRGAIASVLGGGFRRAILQLFELRCLMPGSHRIDQLVEVTLNHPIELVQSQPNAVIGQAVLREVVGTDLLGAITGLDHRAAFVANRVRLFALFQLEQAASQNLQTLGLVLDLTALVLAANAHAGGQVSDLYGAVGGVDA